MCCSSVSPACNGNMGFGQWMHTWNSTIVIRTSHIGFSHWQQHLRNQRRVPLLLGPSNQENLAISFLPNSSHGGEPCYQFSSTVPILKSWAAASMSPFDRQLEASPDT